MAINISNKYPGRSNPPSVDYPQGSIKNQTAPGARDGTPLDEAWANDKEGFFQKILAYRGVNANGLPDTATSSQYFDALCSDPTETLRGLPLVATQSEVNAGTVSSKMVTPASIKMVMGPGQSWQSPSRVIGVTYTNTTTRPILVSVSAVVNELAINVPLSFILDGLHVSMSRQDSLNFNGCCVLVPPSSKYAVLANFYTLVAWREYR